MYMSGAPLLYPQSLYERSYGQAYSDVIITFSRIDRFSISIAIEVPLRYNLGLVYDFKLPQNAFIFEKVNIIDRIHPSCSEFWKTSEFVIYAKQWHNSDLSNFSQLNFITSISNKNLETLWKNLFPFVFALPFAVVLAT